MNKLLISIICVTSVTFAYAKSSHSSSHSNVGMSKGRNDIANLGGKKSKAKTNPAGLSSSKNSLNHMSIY